MKFYVFGYLIKWCKVLIVSKNSSVKITKIIYKFEEFFLDLKMFSSLQKVPKNEATLRVTLEPSNCHI
jgi:hypothetical protein